MSKPKIKFALTKEGVKPPTRASKEAAGFDFYCAENISIPPHQKKMINTYVKHDIPKDVVGILAPRSGHAVKKGLRLFFAPGIIDADYRGEINILVENVGAGFAIIEKDERFAQIVYLQLPALDFEIIKESELSQTERGEGGFGSTGAKDKK